MISLNLLIENYVKITPQRLLMTFYKVTSLEDQNSAKNANLSENSEPLNRLINYPSIIIAIFLKFPFFLP